MKYLGVPVSPNRWTTDECDILADKSSKVLKCWSTRHLLYVERSH